MCLTADSVICSNARNFSLFAVVQCEFCIYVYFLFKNIKILCFNFLYGFIFTIFSEF